MTTNSFALSAEILIRLVKAGYPYKKVPIYNNDVDEGKTACFRIKNIAGIISVIFRLFFEINFGKKDKLRHN